MKIIVYYGGLGTGKSCNALKGLDIQKTYKLGLGSIWFSSILLLRPLGILGHILDNKRLKLEYKNSNARSIEKDIASITKEYVLIDEWTSLFWSTLWWSQKSVKKKVNSIIKALEDNKNIKKCVIITSDYITYLPFNFYKKWALWNKCLFPKATNVYRVSYNLIIKEK